MLAIVALVLTVYAGQDPSARLAYISNATWSMFNLYAKQLAACLCPWIHWCGWCACVWPFINYFCVIAPPWVEMMCFLQGELFFGGITLTIKIVQTCAEPLTRGRFPTHILIRTLRGVPPDRWGGEWFCAFTSWIHAEKMQNVSYS